MVNIRAALGPSLGSFRVFAESPEEWLYTVRFVRVFLPSFLLTSALLSPAVASCVIARKNAGSVRAQKFLLS